MLCYFYNQTQGFILYKIQKKKNNNNKKKDSVDMFIESFGKLSFASYNFIFFNKCNIVVLLKSFVFKEWLVESSKFFFVVMPLFVMLLWKDFVFSSQRDTIVSLSFESCRVFYCDRIFVHFVFQSTLSVNSILEFFSLISDLV